MGIRTYEVSRGPCNKNLMVKKVVYKINLNFKF